MEKTAFMYKCDSKKSNRDILAPLEMNIKNILSRRCIA
jgi:hypothetical protein